MDYPGLWTEVVPIAFHVDYWDGLGWKDPFASKANTQRQYAYAKADDIRSIYTPCFVSNGKEWRGFFERSALPMSSSTAGVLSGELEGNRLKVNYDIESTPLDLHLLILGCDLATDVRRGENRGKKLLGQFVAVHHSVHQTDSNTWQLALPAYETQENARYALALFVSKPKGLSPIQATGTWLP
jgi:hypothetical protein